MKKISIPFITILIALKLILPVNACDVEPIDINAAQARLDALWTTTEELCIEYDIDFEIVIAIMWHESRCNPDIEDSNVGARGLMQIHPINWDWISDENLDVNIPAENIEAGILMLSDLFDEYDLEKALAAYASGITGMKRGDGFWFSDEIMELIEN